MALLARTVMTPLHVEIRSGAVRNLGRVLADGRISPEGRVVVLVGPVSGRRLLDRACRDLGGADVVTVHEASVTEATRIVDELRERSYDAVVGLGGGRTIDVAKWVATRRGLPMVVAATTLSHDGLASPVSVLEDDGHRHSHGVHIPIAVLVDLDVVREAPPELIRSGIGDVVSNLSAIADWRLAHDVRSEPVDGLAVNMALTAAEAVIGRADGVDCADFLETLANGLVLSGLAMAIAGTSRPCSGACHEISHALDQLRPGTGSHGSQVALGALFATFLRGDKVTADRLADCLRRHGLPLRPADLGLPAEQFASAVAAAPSTRPGRFTVLEHLSLGEQELLERVHDFETAYP
ncbi:MAG: iron-containing alcohol dehydrogenase family protein [Streptosporangiaceae bacterium]